MKLNKDTLAVLKYLASINLNLLFKSGSELSTINAARNVIADVTVQDVFPIDFGIYDLNEFLGALSLFENPDVEFSAQCATIKEAGSSLKFYAADASVLALPTRKIVFPAADVEFDLSQTQLATVLKTASVLRATDVSIVGAGGKLSIAVGDLKNDTANNFTLDIGDTDAEFNANIKVANLQLMPQDYRVSLNRKNISRFVNADNTLDVKIALESSSSFQ